MAKDDEAVAKPLSDRRQLGEILLSEGVIDRDALTRSLLAQRESRARIGEILIVRSGADRSAVAAAAARQAGLEFVDLRRVSIDATLIDPESIELFIRERIAPWRLKSGLVAYVAAAPEAAAKHPALRASAGISAAEDQELSRALIGACGPELATRSASRRPLGESLRAGFARWQRFAAIGGLAGAVLLAAAHPYVALTVFLWELYT